MYCEKWFEMEFWIFKLEIMFYYFKKKKKCNIINFLRFDILCCSI